MKFFNPNLVITVLVTILITGAAYIFINRQNYGLDTDELKSLSNPTPVVNTGGHVASTPANFSEIYTGASISGTPLPSQSPLSYYLYKGATIKTQTDNHLELESSEDAAMITEWYKKIIAELNFNAKSFSTTDSNGVVFNKLSAAKPAEKVEINIKKDQSASIVTITVDRF